MRAASSGEAIEVARAAARWLALLESGTATEQDHARLEHWRNSSISHEATWQKAQLLRQRFSGLPPTLAMASLDRPDLARRTAIKRALGITALLPATWLIGRQLPVQVWMADVYTAIGEQKKLQLADGSLLQLNTDSAVNVDLGKRELTLVRGEMALKVAGSAGLTLHLPYGRVIVSRSEVCVRLNDSDCQIAVASGAVQLQPLHGPALLLREGEQVRLKVGGAGQVGSFDASLPGWREGVLIAQNQPLGDFLRELRRFRPGLLRWDPVLENLRVMGSFRLDDTDRVLSLLAASLPLEVHSRTRYWVTLVPRNNQV
ncbi:FecR domain-containing protein [Pseudomonas sichuanensis]|uniref:FecR domain-containing protein n=1 Tax=Pseudomonas sichuanensis TaxID=2213015 RepID=UPI00215E352C|nr:FecR domain-containing protein [Pseudomonas sichuanensis]UVL87217.1 FecR domain-containing protein [Pseudomonas sichuanensis]